MIKFSFLQNLELGSVMEAGSLMPGITSEKLVHLVSEKSPTRITIESYFFGILVCRLEGTPSALDTVVWKKKETA